MEIGMENNVTFSQIIGNSQTKMLVGKIKLFSKNPPLLQQKPYPPDLLIKTNIP
jgi:hypothetical protein